MYVPCACGCVCGAACVVLTLTVWRSQEDLKHLEKVLSAWTVPEIETEESKRDKERKERERKEKLKEKEQQERRERELIELPAKDSPKEKDKETALEKATRRLLHKKTKNKGELESSPDLLNLVRPARSALW